MTTGYAELLLRAVREQRGLVLGDLVVQARRWRVGMSVTFLRGVERGRWSPARWARRRAHLGLPTQPMDTADAFLAAVVDTLEREAVLAVKGLIEVDQ